MQNHLDILKSDISIQIPFGDTVLIGDTNPDIIYRQNRILRNSLWYLWCFKVMSEKLYLGDVDAWTTP